MKKIKRKKKDFRKECRIMIIVEEVLHIQNLIGGM